MSSENSQVPYLYFCFYIQNKSLLILYLEFGGSSQVSKQWISGCRGGRDGHRLGRTQRYLRGGECDRTRGGEYKFVNKTTTVYTSQLVDIVID